MSDLIDVAIAANLDMEGLAHAAGNGDYLH